MGSNRQRARIRPRNFQEQDIVNVNVPIDVAVQTSPAGTTNVNVAANFAGRLPERQRQPDQKPSSQPDQTELAALCGVERPSGDLRPEGFSPSTTAKSANMAGGPR